MPNGSVRARWETSDVLDGGESEFQMKSKRRGHKHGQGGEGEARWVRSGGKVGEFVHKKSFYLISEEILLGELGHMQNFEK